MKTYGTQKTSRNLGVCRMQNSFSKWQWKAYGTSESFLAKVTFESHFRKKTFRCGIHTCASFYLRKL